MLILILDVFSAENFYQWGFVCESLRKLDIKLLSPVINRYRRNILKIKVTSLRSQWSFIFLFNDLLVKRVAFGQHLLLLLP